MRRIVSIVLIVGLVNSLAAARTALAAAAEGRNAWVMEHPQADGSTPRSCASCHTADLAGPGRHVKTGKPIDPMAPSVNPARLRDPEKVEKWLRRNCRWTLGRECTRGEKADFIDYIKSR